MRALALICVAGCGRFGFDPVAAGGDATLVADASWSVAVFNDFSDEHTYTTGDLVDGAETYDNAPDAMFVMSAPYPEALAVIAGRDILEVTATSVISHRVGTTTTPNTALPDHIRSGVWTSSFAGAGPAVLLTSSSDMAGDGLYVMSTQWMATRDINTNNTRGLLVDLAGTFDNRGVSEIYLATSGGVVRRSDSATLFTGDSKSLAVLGTQMLVSRTVTVDVDVRLLEVDSMIQGSYPERLLAGAAQIEIGEGTPPGGVAWLLFDARELKVMDASGNFTRIAAATDPDARWEAAVSPPAGHPLATAPGIVYVLETNRVLDRDRVLVFTPP